MSRPRVKYLGRYPVGTEIPLVLRCTLAGAPDSPARHPTVEVRPGLGVPVYFGRVAADGQGDVVGLFRAPLLLSAAFTPGRYNLAFRWLESTGGPRVEWHALDVIGGGDARGSPTSLQSVVRPHASFLLYETDAGQLVRGANPR